MDNVEKLIELSDEGYKHFLKKLVPNIPKEKILGVRIPELRKLAKDMKGTEDAKAFLSALPHRYLDEENLQAILVSELKDPEETLREIDRFLPFIDNWMTSDTMNPKSIRKDLENTRKHAFKWLGEKGTYQKRYAITTFMKYFPDDLVAMEEIARIKSDDYYIDMAAAWYWSEMMVKNPESALPYIEDNKLDSWIRAKAIQKAIESYRVPEELKEHLRSIR